jgi:hypothetical protein
MATATLLHQDGDFQGIQPVNGTDFSLSELKDLLGCSYIEVIYLDNEGDDDDLIMIGDEEGRLISDPVENVQATKIYRESWGCEQNIVGNIILCPSSMLK